MRRIGLIVFLPILILGLLVTPPVQRGLATFVRPWTARGVAQQVIYCPNDDMVVIPETIEVTDNRLWREGIIHFRARCVTQDRKTVITITGSSFLDLTWHGWKSVSTGYNIEQP